MSISRGTYARTAARLRTPVAALLAASLTAAAVARTSRADDGKLKVVTTLHCLKSIAKEIGGDAVEVEALARPVEDPHEVTATPTRQKQLSDADAFIESGFQLELWDENCINGATNPRIQKSADGFCFAGNGEPMLNVPAKLDRSGGDLHPFGNPHIWFSPFVGHVYAKNIEACLGRIAGARAATWEKNRKAFDRKLDEAIFGKELVELMGGPRLEKLARAGKLHEFLAEHKLKGQPLSDLLGGLMKKGEPLRGRTVVSYHSSWPYFEATYGLTVAGAIEPKPGIAPTPGHLEELERRCKQKDVRVIIVTSYEPRSVAEDFATRIGARVVVLPSDVGAEGTTTWFDFHEALVDRLAAALPPQAPDGSRKDEKK